MMQAYYRYIPALGRRDSNGESKRRPSRVATMRATWAYPGVMSCRRENLRRREKSNWQ